MRSAGEAGCLTNTWRGKLWSAIPIVTVAEDDDLRILYIPPGTKAIGSTSQGIPERDQMERSERLLISLETGEWNRLDVELPWPVLLLCPRDAWWQVNITWLSPGEVLGWKIDAARPLVETDYGYDSMDLMLDVIASPDLSSWHLKDEEELAAAEHRNLLAPEEFAAIRDGIAEVTRRIESRESPFELHWLDWKPDPDYPQPTIPSTVLESLT